MDFRDKEKNLQDLYFHIGKLYELDGRQIYQT